MCVCMYVCMDGWIHACMYVCMYVCVYVCMYGFVFLTYGTYSEPQKLVIFKIKPCLINHKTSRGS